MPFLAPVAGLAAAQGLVGIGAGTGIFASFMTFLQGGSLLATIVKAGFMMAAQYALGALFGPKPVAQASQLDTTYGDKLPRSVILGRVGIAGQHVFRNARGKGNRTVDDVYVLSHFRISDVTRAKGEGFWRDISGEDVIEIPDTEGDVLIRKYYGTMDQVADASLVSGSGGRWKNTSHGKGVAYVIARTKLDVEGPTTPYDPLFEVYGPKLYDWRKDTSVGGDGSDRWNNQDSWTGSPENPVLQMYLLERGVFNGTELMVGKGVSPARLPLAEWTVAANICDELISTDAGFVPRYRSSLIAGAGEGVTHDSNMQPLLEACAASWVEDASGEYPIVGAPQAVVATFTDGDLILMENYRYSEKRKRAELVNTVAGSFIDPTIFYDDGPIATRIDEGALIVDGERLAVSLPFKAVTYSEQADRLADIQTRSSRYQANADICLRPKFIAIKPGRWVRWNSAKHGDKTYLVLSKRLGAMGSNSARNVSLSLQQIGAGVFDPTEYETVPTTPLPPGTPDYQSEVDNIVVQPYVMTSEAAGEIPAIRVAFDPIEDTTIVAVDFKYWPTAQPDQIQYDSLPMPATVKFLTVGVISSTEYQVEYTLRSDPPRTIPPVGPYSVTTPAAAATDITVKLANLSVSTRQLLQNLMAQQAYYRAKLQQLALATTDMAGQATKTESVAVKFQNGTAAAMQELTASVEMIDDMVVAMAQSITAINATLGTNEAGALFRMYAEAGDDNIIARISLQVRASLSSSEWVTAATVWEVGTDEADELFGRIVLSAAQTMITTQMGDVIALFDEDGVHLSNAFIANLTGDHIAFNTLTGNHIIVGSIDSPSLAFGAVTEFADLGYSFSRSFGGGTDNSRSMTAVVTEVVSNPGGIPVLQVINLETQVGFSSSGSIAARIGISRNGVQIAQADIPPRSSGATVNTNFVVWDTSGETNVTYEVRTGWNVLTGGGSSASLSFTSASSIMFWKR